jgi:hypothetical protein
MTMIHCCKTSTGQHANDGTTPAKPSRYTCSRPMSCMHPATFNYVELAACMCMGECMGHAGGHLCSDEADDCCSATTTSGSMPGCFSSGAGGRCTCRWPTDCPPCRCSGRGALHAAWLHMHSNLNTSSSARRPTYSKFERAAACTACAYLERARSCRQLCVISGHWFLRWQAICMGFVFTRQYFQRAHSINVHTASTSVDKLLSCMHCMARTCTSCTCQSLACSGLPGHAHIARGK